MSGINKAVKVLGSQAALARELNLSAMAVSKWVKKGHPPAERVVDIEAACNGEVTRAELRPDLYPEESPQ